MTHKLNKVQGYLLVVNDESKVLAHLPSDGYPVQEGLPLLPPYSRHQEDDVEELANHHFRKSEYEIKLRKEAFIDGYNKAREKYKYTEEDLKKALLIKHDGLDIEYVMNRINKYPTEFECEMVYDCCKRYLNCIGCDATEDMINLRPKTITTAHGIQWVGKYK